MNIPLSRLIDGIITTMRTDVIPHVGDSYARGQAIGVIDLLNNLAPRIEWMNEPLARQVEAKRLLLDEVERLVPDSGARAAVPENGNGSTAEDLLAARDALDSRLGDVIARLWSRRREPACGEAIALVRQHLHDEMVAEMKKTRKPLFAEIASGGGNPKS